MEIKFRKADTADAELLTDIYNSSFYDDYLRYGTCPGYGLTKEQMEESIIRHPKYIILCDAEFQDKGIGTQAIQFLKTLLEDWRILTLVTPIDKEENVRFYTEKCGFQMVSTEMDGNVELARFVLER